MKNYLEMVLFVVVVSLLYTGIAQFLPQLENHPPAVVEASPTSTIGPEDLSAAGEEVFQAACVQCHKLGESGRCPDLASMGSLAKSRAEERASATNESFTDVDYLVEALCKPEDYLVEGFGNIMPAQTKALSGGQVLAVVAFLQDQGGAASVKGSDMEPLERFACISAGGGEVETVSVPEPVGSPEEVFAQFACGACHQLTTPTRTVGPSLMDVGARLSKSELYEALLDPDATIADGGDMPYSPGMMTATLGANGFYERMTAEDYRALVNWLASPTGE